MRILFSVCLLCILRAGSAWAQNSTMQESLSPSSTPVAPAATSKPVAPASTASQGAEGSSSANTTIIAGVTTMNQKLEGLRDGCKFVERQVDEKTKKATKGRSWCKPKGEGATVCMELEHGKSKVFDVVGVPRGRIKAGAPVHLIVKAPQGRVALVVCDGDKAPDLGARLGKKSSGDGTRGPGGEVEGVYGSPDYVVSATFYPRMAGTLSAQGVLGTSYGPVVGSAQQNLEAEATYSSAVHVGMSIMLGAAVDLEYEGVQVPGSRQREIVATKATPVDVDLTLGFTPFIDGQRESGCYSSDCFAPYFGLGLYSPKTKEVLKSVILGVNYQITKDLSLSAVGVLRRVSVLSEGYHVGMAVNETDGFTTKTWKLGWGLVLNLSPSILKSGLDAYRDKDLRPIFEQEED